MISVIGKDLTLRQRAIEHYPSPSKHASLCLECPHKYRRRGKSSPRSHRQSCRMNAGELTNNKRSTSDSKERSGTCSLYPLSETGKDSWGRVMFQWRSRPWQIFPLFRTAIPAVTLSSGSEALSQISCFCVGSGAPSSFPTEMEVGGGCWESYGNR